MPRNQEIAGQKDSTPMNQERVASNRSAGFGTNEEPESREITEMDENVMVPINM